MADDNIAYDATGMTTVVRRDTKLLRCAQEVFGVIVKDAWISTFHGQRSELSEAAERISADAERLHRKGMLELAKGALQYDGCEIILRFGNGNQVRFTNSEWASMSRVDVSTMIQLP